MLPKRNRVEKALFKDVFDRGVSFHSPSLSLVVYKDRVTTDSKFSCTVSKKVAKSAVLRNKLRRRGYSALEALWDKIPQSFVGVFSVKHGADKLSFDQFSSEVQKILRLARIIK